MARRGSAKPVKAAARAKGPASRPIPVASAIPSALPSAVTTALNTPNSSTYPSTYPSEDEGEHFVRISNMEESLEGLSLEDAEKQREKIAGKKVQKPFPLLDLPPELRLKIYGFHFATSGNSGDKAIDLDPDNYKRIHTRLLPLLRTCRTVYNEASYYFYSTYPFRLFPTHYGRFFKTKKPLLARLAPRLRGQISTLELRVGPGWNKPPRGWVVNDALGLRDCVSAHKLRVFVEFDPGHPAFQGWRKSDGFYEGFCQKLLDDVLKGVPSLTEVEFDSFPSIKLSGDLMQRMLQTTLQHGRRVTFGPARGWKSIDDVDDEDTPGPTSDEIAAMDLLNTTAPIAVVVS
ncbi:hypothetical protein MCOR25_000280 [Pyricularia grisea]|uniref:Uncharacterized protein n=1 Tax=Pyricularia grisea TaxID=148305 RepID=A0A6P8APN3_PYRGI|nr:hypothetical protein PgNI_11449 [Pyricularia grisea]KAI6383092.1 hypothetical protein MCOR25_000280 [Pyricularia grisea]TLD03990.1 hypothetical protein PgNI_11449 [Pyricularia grisea]